MPILRLSGFIVNSWPLYMKRVHRPLLVMHADASFRERVRHACGSEYRYQALPDWETLRDAEYMAITRLQADALVTVDPVLAARADGVVPVAPLEVLLQDE